MHKHESLILWERKDQKFVDNKYSRAHLWGVDGVKVPASSSPALVVDVTAKERQSGSFVWMTHGAISD